MPRRTAFHAGAAAAAVAGAAVTLAVIDRWRSDVTIEPVAGPTVSRRQLSWMFECFGEVARATSLDNETKSEFTTTSELRRLGL